MSGGRLRPAAGAMRSPVVTCCLHLRLAICGPGTQIPAKALLLTGDHDEEAQS